MKDPTLQNGTDARLEAQGYRVERELVQTVEALGDRASDVATDAKAAIATTKALSKPVIVGGVVAAAALTGGLVWALARRRPSLVDRLLAPPRRRSRVLPVLGRAATSLAIAAATTAARAVLLSKLEHALERALETSEASEA